MNDTCRIAAAVAAAALVLGASSSIAHARDDADGTHPLRLTAAPQAGALSRVPVLDGDAAPALQFRLIGTAAAALSIVTRPSGVDLNHDGHREFVIREDKADIWTTVFAVYQSPANDTFDLVHTIPVSVPGSSSYYPSDVGDGDGDGLSELLAYGRTGNDFDVRLYESPTPSSFPSVVAWQLADGWWPVGALIADTDADGRSEIVVAGQSYNNENRIAVYENTADNAYHQTYYQAFPALHTSQSMAVGSDIDGDGQSEILFGGLTAATATVYMVENTGDNEYTQNWSATLVASDGQPINVEHIVDAGDLDGDGRREFLAGGLKTEALPGGSYKRVYYLFEAIGNDSFSPVAGFSMSGSVIANSCIAVGDLNGDGRAEVITSLGSKVVVYVNTGDNHFAVAWRTRTADNSRAIGVGDHDADGRPEMLFRKSGLTSILEYSGPVGP
jgi:VCBS repeat protein